MGPFLAGFAEMIITPPAGVEMAGYANRAGPARGVHDPLKAIAVVFDDRSGQKSVLCGVDVCGLTDTVATTVRRSAALRIATRPERILLAATHTHSGPSLKSDLLINQQWIRTLEDSLVRVIQEADMLRREARIGMAVGAVDGIGGNRRDPRHGAVDRSVNVLRVDDAHSGKMMGVIVNHACHATTLDLSNLLLSADYPGVLRDTVQSGLDDRPVVLFLNGACGDINPGGYSAEDSALGKPIPWRTFERAAEIGAALGAETLRLLPTATMQERFPLHAGSLKIGLPMRPFPLPAEAASVSAAAKERLAAAQEEGADGATLDRLRLEAMYAGSDVSFAQRYSQAPNKEWPVEIQGLAIGQVLFLALPGEAFNEIGSRLKDSSPFEHTVVVGYANSGAGYFPTVEALRGGGYEVKESMFGEVAMQKFEGWAAVLARGLHASRERAAASADAALADPPAPPRENPMLRQPLHEIRRARFPAIDAHMHTPGLWIPIREKLAAMDAAGVRYVVDLFGDTLPGAEFAPALRHQQEEQGRVLHCFGFDFRRIDDADWPEYVREKIRQDKERGGRGIKLFKEVGLIYTDSGGHIILPDDERLTPIWQGAAEAGLPVIYHIADPTRNFAPIDGAYEDLQALDVFSLRWRFGAPGHPSHEALLACEERLLAANPETTFILPHLAALDADLERLGTWLRKYPNLYVDTAARLYELGSQPHTAREFFLAFPDRILWGTDQAWPNRNDDYHAWFRFLETRDEGFPCASFGKLRYIHGLGLPDEVLRQVYGATAARLLGIKDWPGH